MKLNKNLNIIDPIQYLQDRYPDFAEDIPEFFAYTRQHKPALLLDLLEDIAIKTKQPSSSESLPQF